MTDARRGVRLWLLPSLCYATAIVWLSWPLARDLGGQLPCFTGFSCRFDPVYVAWALAGESRALVTAPARLFDANIYHPTPSALAYGPSALGALPFFAPAFVLGGNPSLAVNVVLLAGLLATALALHATLVGWTGSSLAGGAAAVAFLGSPWVWTWVPSSPHYAVLAGLPLAWLLASRPPTALGTAAIAVLLAWQALVEPVYYAPAVFVPLAALAAARLVRRRSRRSGIALAGALAAAALLVLPVVLAYARVRSGNPSLADQSVWQNVRFFPAGRTLELTADGLAGIGPVEMPWALVGLIVVGGLLAAVARRRVRHPGSAWGVALVATAVGLLLSSWRVVAGRRSFAMPVFTLVDRLVPSYEEILRIPERVGVATLIGSALLVGLAVDACGRVAAHARPAAATVVRGALVVALAVVLSGRLHARLPQFFVWRGPELPPLAMRALETGDGPVLEIPVGEGSDPLHPPSHAAAMFRSIFHHRPLLNGYSSYYPAAFPRRMVLAHELPALPALARLAAETQLTTILVHLHDLPPDVAARWTGTLPGLIPKPVDAGHLLFEVDRTSLGPPPEQDEE